MTKSPDFLNPLLGIQILKHVHAAESEEHDSKWYHVPLRTQLRAKHHILLDDNDSPQANKHLPTSQRALSKIEPRFVSQAIYQHPSSSGLTHERFPKHTVLSQAYSFRIQDCMKTFAAVGYNSGRGGVNIQERIVGASGMRWGFEIYICV